MLSADPIPFAEFMRRALHDPERGYYARRIAGIGARGDFTTAPMLSGLPARALARWAAHALRETGCRDLVEIGPGEGLLALAVWKALPRTLRWRTRLHLVESSDPLAARQRSLLGRAARWHKQPADAMRACGGRAVLFSNELLDAFPVRLFARTAADWREVHVGLDPHGRIVETLVPATLPDSSVFQQPFASGQRVETHDSLLPWFASWLPLWKSGRMLTIDYGAADAAALYHRRPRGTLRAYLLHQRCEGPAIYQNPGRQDITADVNFADIRDWTRDTAATRRLESLADFLVRWEPAAASGMFRDPNGPGSAFLALEQEPAGPA